MKQKIYGSMQDAINIKDYCNAIIECVPNFSEGRDINIINAIANSITSVNNVDLLFVDSNASANRTVFTFVGNPENVFLALFKAMETASIHIDMSTHKGIHPRMGVLDVCPFIALKNISSQELTIFVNDFAKKMAIHFKLPIYLYELSQTKKYRQQLNDIRKGEYEGWNEKIKQKEWLPDYGEPILNKKLGVTAMGVRHLLIAYNINLDTTDIQIAKNIACKLRESGGYIVHKDNKKEKIKKGLLPYCKAIAWYVKEFDTIQISTNITNPSITPIEKVFTTTMQLALENNVNVKGSEIVGLISLQYILQAGKYFNCNITDENQLIDSAIKHLGLSSVKMFDTKKQILRY